MSVLDIGTSYLFFASTHVPPTIPVVLNVRNTPVRLSSTFHILMVVFTPCAALLITSSWFIPPTRNYFLSNPTSSPCRIMHRKVPILGNKIKICLRFLLTLPKTNIHTEQTATEYGWVFLKNLYPLTNLSSIVSYLS